MLHLVVVTFQATYAHHWKSLMRERYERRGDQQSNCRSELDDGQRASFHDPYSLWDTQ